MNDNLISISAVVESTSLSRATIYRRIAEGSFPAPAKIGGSSRWSRHELNAWMERELAKRIVREVKPGTLFGSSYKAGDAALGSAAVFRPGIG